MIGASRRSSDDLRERFDAQESTAGADDLRTAADDLRACVHMLDREHALRRALGDPAQSADRKGELVTGLLRGQIADSVLEILVAAVGLRWSKPGDLPDAIEQLAVIADAGAAEKDGQLDALEDELFRFARIIDAQSDLRAALSDPAAPAESKSALLTDLLGGRATAVTLRLVNELVLHPRGRALDRGLETIARYVAQRRRRLMALVRTAVPLDDERRARLTAALTRLYDHEIHLNVELDPDLIGGVSVQVGDEIIDGTIAGRLDVARRRSAG
jgi:F-type H+-transporting ATPase subunit delta